MGVGGAWLATVGRGNLGDVIETLEIKFRQEFTESVIKIFYEWYVLAYHKSVEYLFPKQ